MECTACNQEMTDPKVTTCTLARFGDEKQDRDSSHFDGNERCHDCGIVNKPGHFHHPGCDVERCALCGGQVIGCDCGSKGGS